MHAGSGVGGITQLQIITYFPTLQLVGTCPWRLIVIKTTRPPLFGFQFLTSHYDVATWNIECEDVICDHTWSVFDAQPDI